MNSHPAPLRLSRACAMVLAAFLILTGGCATAPNTTDREAVAEFNKINDPGEPTNRAIFEFNRSLDTGILKPLATLYRDFTPQFLQDRVNDVLDNLHAPVVFLNDILQGEGDRAMATLTRFVINSTVGLLGLVDVATEAGIEQHDEDFGQTLAVWGMGEGPYVMLPIFGPSNPRDTIGLIVDFLTDPFNIWATNTDRESALFARAGARAIDTRAIYMDPMDDLEKSSVDFYASIRNLYRQRRGDQIRNGESSTDLPAPGLGLSPPGPRLKDSEELSRTQ